MVSGVYYRTRRTKRTQNETDIRMEKDENETMSTKEVAELLGVSRRTITRLASQEKLPGASKVGGQWKFKKEAIRNKYKNII